TQAGPSFPEAFEREVHELHGDLNQRLAPYLVRRLLLDVGGHTERLMKDQHGDHFEIKVQGARRRLAEAGCPIPGVQARTRYAWIRQATTGCLQRPVQRPITWTDRLDRVLTHKVWGTLIFLSIMFVVFASIYPLAKILMDQIKAGQDALGVWVQSLMNPGPLR